MRGPEQGLWHVEAMLGNMAASRPGDAGFARPLGMGLEGKHKLEGREPAMPKLLLELAASAFGACPVQYRGAQMLRCNPKRSQRLPLPRPMAAMRGASSKA